MSYLIIAIIVLSILVYAINSKYFFIILPVTYAFAAQAASDKQLLLGIPFNMSMLFGLMVLFFTLFECFKAIINKGGQFFDSLSIITILFIFYVLITNILSIDPWKSFTSLVKMSTWIMVILAARELFKSENDLKKISIFASLCCLIIIAFYLLSRFGLYGGQSEAYQKWDIDVYTGGFYGPTGLSLPLVMAIPAILTASWNRWNWLRNIIISMSIIIILLSYLRSAIIMVFAGYCIFAYYSFRYTSARSLRVIILPIFSMFLIISVVAVFDSGQIFKRWESTVEQADNKDYQSMGSGRVGLLQNAFNFYLNKQTAYRMLFGNGLGNSWIATSSRKVAHNDIAEVLLGCGALGLLLYSILLFSIGIKLRKIIFVNRYSIFGMAACLGVFSFASFLTGHFRGISQSVFPLSIMAVHIGAIMGINLGQQQHEPEVINS